MAGHNSSVPRTSNEGRAEAATTKRSLSQWCEDGSITVYQGPLILWQGMPAELAAQPDLVARVWPRRADLLRRAVREARCIQSAERGRKRGCTPRSIAKTERLPDHAYLGTPIYRVSYYTNGTERRTAAFALKANALKAKTLLQAKYGNACLGG